MNGWTKQSSLCHYNAMNVLSMHALIGAYQPEGHEWVDELRQPYLTENVDYAYRYITEHFEGVTLAKAPGYLYAVSGLRGVVQIPS